MAFLAGIFNKQQPAAPAAPAPTGGPVAAQMNGPANPGAAPANMLNQPAPAPAPAADPHPLDQFTEYFKPKVQDPNAQHVPTLADPFLPTLNPQELRQKVATANFAAGIPAEKMQAAMSGDAAAFAEVLNHASREAFAAATQMAHQLAETSARTGVDRFNGTLDSRVREMQLRGQTATNPALNHPAAAPMLAAVKMQIASTNPNLGAAEVQAQAEQYFTEFANSLAPKAATPTQPTPGKSDFSYLLN